MYHLSLFWNSAHLFKPSGVQQYNMKLWTVNGHFLNEVMYRRLVWNENAKKWCNFIVFQVKTVWFGNDLIDLTYVAGETWAIWDGSLLRLWKVHYSQWPRWKFNLWHFIKLLVYRITPSPDDLRIINWSLLSFIIYQLCSISNIL